MIQASTLNATPWSIEEEKLDAKQVELHQTLFAQANGFLGIRGCVEEGYQDGTSSTEGTYLNGVYSRESIPYGESAYGFATHNQKVIQAPNGKQIDIFLDDEHVKFGPEKVVSHKQTLDFKTGILNRETDYVLSAQRTLKVQIERFVSLEHKSLMVTKFSLSVDNFNGRLKIVSGLDTGYSQSARKGDPRVTESSVQDAIELLDASVNKSQCLMVHQVKGVDTQVASLCEHLKTTGMNLTGDITEQSRVCVVFETECEGRRDVSFEKRVVYQHATSSTDSLKKNITEKSKATNLLSYEDLVDYQRRHYDAFWGSSDIELEGDDKLQQGLRFNQFHLFQSAGRGGSSSISAKGLTGHGYDGHYFWDTEIYIIPSLTFSQPQLARDLLVYRVNTLTSAKYRARQLSINKGALYAWRTIGGEECSAYYPASTAQYHINAAIAYAFKVYLDATGDWSLMISGGADVVFETARLWPQLGHFNARKQGQFCIDGVTGPDEYTAVVNNNFYTNVMAQMHLRFAAKLARNLLEDSADDYSDIARRIKLSNEEIEQWEKIAEQMYLPFDSGLGINPQDDQFLDKALWDFDNTPEDKYPLLLHFHPLVIYRHQVLKQADVILAMFLLGEQFDKTLKQKNLSYYEPLTTHDSTLSGCIYGIVNANVGHYEQATKFLENAARMDLDNLHHNTEYGVHTASMAGSWNTLVYGFAGMISKKGELSFKPFCPEKWRHYQFSISLRTSQLIIKVTPHHTEYRLIRGQRLSISHWAQNVILSDKSTVLCHNGTASIKHD